MEEEARREKEHQAQLKADRELAYQQKRETEEHFRPKAQKNF